MGDKEKMSRALGTAFLTHQVAQLEKAVIAGGANNNSGRSGGKSAKRGRGTWTNNRRGASGVPPTRDVGEPKAEDDDDRTFSRTSKNYSIPPADPEKVADRIVLDSSVLVHSLGKVRTWCRDNSKEVIIVPLEALNTLDLLKKGTNRLAIRARNASRLLEDQVGANPRIVVQGDNGYVPWEDVFASTARNRLSSDSDNTNGSTDPEEAGPRSSSEFDRSRQPVSAISLTSAKRAGDTPEWLKRTICCAKYEQLRPKDALDGDLMHEPELKVVLAVARVPHTDRANQENRYENRASGALARQWATSAGIEVLDVDVDGEKENNMKEHPNHRVVKVPQARIDLPEGITVKTEEDISPWMGSLSIAENTGPDHHRRKHSNEGPNSAKPWNSSPRRTSFNHREEKPHNPRYGPNRKPAGNLVEKPNAPIPLTHAGLLPAGKVIRVLARGEKLEP